MASNHLAADLGQNVGHMEPALFVADVDQEERVQQQVAQFFRQVLVVLEVDGLNHLVNFAHYLKPQRLQGLFPIPGASIRSPQAGQNVGQLGQAAFLGQRRNQQGVRTANTHSAPNLLKPVPGWLACVAGIIV